MQEIHVDQAIKYHQITKNRPSVVGYVDKYNPNLRGAIILRKSDLKIILKRFNLRSIHPIQNELHTAILYFLLKNRALKLAK